MYSDQARVDCCVVATLISGSGCFRDETSSLSQYFFGCFLLFSPSSLRTQIFLTLILPTVSLLTVYSFTMASEDCQTQTNDTVATEPAPETALEPASTPALPDYLASPNAVFSDEGVQWRYGQAPDYSKTRKVWEEGKLKFIRSYCI